VHRRARTPRWLHTLRLNVRDTLVLLRQFREVLLAFSLTVLGGGGLYHALAQTAGVAEPGNLPEAMYLVLSMMFFQAGASFPDVWYLQIFFFLTPLAGLFILAQGAADFGVLLFNRRARGDAWEVAVAETYSNHIVIVGIGHLGFRVARALHEIGEAFVIVEGNPEAELISHAHEWKAPIIRGDALKQSVLRDAGVERAHTIVIATSDDTMNLQIAIHARAANPGVRTIIRLFDDEFAREVRSAFGITAAYSASALAAPSFAAAAAGLEVTQAITINGRRLLMSQVAVAASSTLIGRSVSQVEHQYDLSIVLLRRGNDADLHPNNEMLLRAEDQITVFADIHTLHELNRTNSA
jgi:Trk K+ transport system NAD-binding subunit